MKACIVLLSLALAGSPAAAQVVLGSGNITCEDFATARAEKTVVAYAAQNWVLGYVSAYNQFVPGAEGDVSRGRTISEVLARLDDLCAANPRHTVQRTAVALLEEMKPPANSEPEPEPEPGPAPGPASQPAP